MKNNLIDFEKLQDDTVKYLQSLQISESWKFKFSHSNQASLIGSSLAGMLGGMLGYNQSLQEEQRQDWADYINSYQRDDGWFEDEDISEINLCLGYAKDRALLHRTRHALLALKALCKRPSRNFIFVEKWLGDKAMWNWCETLNLEDYWYTSNMMMDAAIFLMDYSCRNDSPASNHAIHELLNFCDAHIDPKTGYHDSGKSDLRNAMAGAMHLYPVYILMNREIKHVEKIIDTTLSLQQPDGLFGYESGTGGEDCLDYDAVLILSNMFFLSRDFERKKQIEKCFQKCLTGIMVNQVSGGGFSCHRRNENYYFGTKTTIVPPGGSSLWATYSRLMAIAMMSKILNLPGNQKWQLKNNLMEIWNAQS